MLAAAPIIHVVAETLREYAVGNLVVDPVMVSTSGHALLDEEAVDVLTGELFPLATLVTPNLAEAERLSGLELRGLERPAPGGRAHPGHGPGRGGDQGRAPRGGRRPGRRPPLHPGRRHRQVQRAAPRRACAPHGSGCTFSAAIAAYLARGETLPNAVRKAKRLVTAAIERGPGDGPGLPPRPPPARRARGRTPFTRCGSKRWRHLFRHRQHHGRHPVGRVERRPHLVEQFPAAARAMLTSGKGRPPSMAWPSEW